MKPSINYPDLQEILQKIGLILREHKQHRTMKGVAFEALVESETGPVTICKEAVYQNLRVSGRSPNEVAGTIFSLMSKNLILIGNLCSYKEKVVYKNGVFKRELLTKEELELCK